MREFVTGTYTAFLHTTWGRVWGQHGLQPVRSISAQTANCIGGARTCVVLSP